MEASISTGLSSPRETSPAAYAALMDRTYRWQRHVYDLTRKYYLLGRDRLIDDLDVPEGGSVLELGCGTGRNMIAIARRYPGAEVFGLDISCEMLKSAERSAAAAGLSRRLCFSQGDASVFDADAVFGRRRFSRVVFSYTLSMIPRWREALAAGMDSLEPGGSLHLVDFGQQERLPRAFKWLLFGWLARFHVRPRAELEVALRRIAAERDAAVSFASLHGGYSWYAVLTLPSD